MSATGRNRRCGCGEVGEKAHRTAGVTSVIGAIQPPGQMSPEQALAWACIEDAINTLRCGGRTAARERDERPADLVAETDAWFASRACDWIHAFECCCAVLRIEPDDVRAMLARAKQRPDWLVASRPRPTRVRVVETPGERERQLYARYRRGRSRRRKLPRRVAQE